MQFGGGGGWGGGAGCVRRQGQRRESAPGQKKSTRRSGAVYPPASPRSSWPLRLKGVNVHANVASAHSVGCSSCSAGRSSQTEQLPLSL